MMKNNYLFDFADKLDCLISEINKLNAKVRLYRKNSSKFNFDFNVKFTISPDCFMKKLKKVVFITKKLLT